MDQISVSMRFTLHERSMETVPDLIATKIRAFGCDPADFRVSITASEPPTPVGPSENWHIEVEAESFYP
jgi:hypothetical protein